PVGGRLRQAVGRALRPGRHLPGAAQAARRPAGPGGVGGHGGGGGGGVTTAPSLAARVLQGDVRAASRLMRWIDDGLEGTAAELRAIFPHAGKAYVVGITGSPGAGKSSLTDRLIAICRKRGLTVGVLAVDPTSPFTGGAILGDRIRMQDHAGDPGVF